MTGRERHAAHVAPSRAVADLVVDGTTDEFAMIAEVLALIGPVPAEPVRTAEPPPSTAASGEAA